MWLWGRKKFKVGRTKIIIHWRSRNKDRRTDILDIVKDWTKEDKRIRRFRKIKVIVADGEREGVRGQFKPEYFKKFGFHIFLYVRDLVGRSLVETLRHELLHNEQFKHRQYNSYKQQLSIDENLEDSINDGLQGILRLFDEFEEVRINATDSPKEAYKKALKSCKSSVRSDRDMDHETIDLVIVTLRYFLAKMSIEGQASFCERVPIWNKGTLDKKREEAKAVLKTLIGALDAYFGSVSKSSKVRKEYLNVLSEVISMKTSARKKTAMVQNIEKIAMDNHTHTSRMSDIFVSLAEGIKRNAYRTGEYMTYTILYAFDKFELDDLIKKDAFKFVRLYERACKKLDLDPLVSLGDTSAIYCHKQQLKKWRVLIKRKRRILRVAKR